MARPKKLDALTRNVSGRIRTEQDIWLRAAADRRFEGEFSRTLRWAIDQAQVFDWLMNEPDPVAALDEMLNPPEDRHPEEDVLEAERELEAWKRERAIKRAQRKAKGTQ